MLPEVIENTVFNLEWQYFKDDDMQAAEGERVAVKMKVLKNIVTA